MKVSKNSFDYIIVGAGASGCVLANRLSADPTVRVLVLEAGGSDKDPNIADIGGFVKLWGSDKDWNLKTIPQPGLLNREITINQGKVLGGSSSINAMMYVRGNSRNFDQWNSLGADGWSYEELLPLFKKLEDYSGGDWKFHNKDGELKIGDCPEPEMRAPEFLKAAAEIGYNEPHWDYNGARQENSAGYLQFHIDRNGKRESGATAFLHPVMDRENLVVITNTQVARVIIDDKKATGVAVIKDGKEEIFTATSEVILSAGALASPKILLLSGIGPKMHLEEIGIPVNADLPGVGHNLQDHLQLPVIFRSGKQLPNTSLLTGNVLFIRSRKNENAAPDIQINFTPSLPAPLKPLLPDFGGQICIFLAILVQPFSSGYVKLQSTDPYAPPLINPNYLQQEADLKALAIGVEVIRKIAGSPAFAELNQSEIAPGAADMEDFIRSQASTLWHPAGTCKMGQDAMAVVNPKLQVWGIKNLRVADASIMPNVTSGNTVASCFMIGEKAAALIMEDKVRGQITVSEKKY
ncbi:MAG: GMC family oxidoreductase N-terminal domain-containing protein [Opitutaceae bacterium]|nr:GMC family oxidoreductase N-terminal domain-containing protein [Cytophagales bacterium]